MNPLSDIKKSYYWISKREGTRVDVEALGVVIHFFLILQGKDYVGEKYSRQGKISQLFTLVLAIGMEITICKYANDSVFYGNCEGHGDTERNVRELGPSWLRSASFPRWVSLQRLFHLADAFLDVHRWQITKSILKWLYEQTAFIYFRDVFITTALATAGVQISLCPLMDLLSMIYWQTIPTKGHSWFILRYSLADHKDRRRTIHCVFFKTGNQRACPRNHWWACQLIC